MTVDLEKYVPSNKAILFNDRMAVSARTLFQIVREFFEPHFLIHQIEFGDHLCWMGFRTVQTGDANRGWVRIESGLGAKAPGERQYHLLDLPPIQVGSVSVRALSPIASRVLIRTDYTPDALASLFNGLVQYLIWVVNGEDAREAWSRATSGVQIKMAPQVDADEPPLLSAPSQSRGKTRDEETSTNQPKAKKVKRGTSHRKTRVRSRTGAKRTRRRGKQRIEVPSGPVAFERYRKMWRIICQTRRAYLNPPNDKEERRPNPTMDELRDAIEEKMMKRYSEKTVRRVIQAGSAGLLKKR